MKPAVFAALCLSAVSALALASAPSTLAAEAENLLKNGDFEKGVTYWRGDRKVIGEEGKPENHVAQVDVNKRQARFFHQEADTRDMKDIRLTFRMKASADYKGRGVQLRFKRRQGGFTYRDLDVAAGADWKDVTWNFGEIRGENKLVLEVEVKDGDAGSVYFDDFVLVEAK
jgi:hypothetical protein